ncbi:hypothetical protein [Phytopseudomonas daroniae]|uniref:hypothetical protein n=1 Tax=Phytopseudomonas daroniae TaxID=2487519 RepID=UPI0010385877|nr:hypothetical protein [Pseudomonas daroniae]
MKWIYRIMLAFSTSLLFAGQSLASKYELQINNAAPATGTVRLFLESPLRSDTPFITRQLNGSNIENPVCATSNKALLRQDGEWLAPAGCSEIAWSIRFSAATNPDHDVSMQDNLYYPGRWWLFSEWGNLLRLSSNTAESEICTKGHITICRRVPSLKEAPLLMLIGVPENRFIFGKTSFNFFTGHLPSNFNVKNLYRSYDRQVSYLYEIMASINTSQLPEVIDVLVLGIDSSLGVLGGAAGRDTYLANISVTEQGVNSSERVRHLWIAAHEMAHLLGLETNALWASESLAHYYGFKSLEKNKDAFQLFDQMTDEIDQIGLLKAHRLVAQGEGQYYAQFYAKGAAFWRDVDQALIQATQGKKSLDDYLSLLVNGQFGINGELPAEFLEALVEMIGKDNVDRLHQDYL